MGGVKCVGCGVLCKIVFYSLLPCIQTKKKCNVKKKKKNYVTTTFYSRPRQTSWCSAIEIEEIDGTTIYGQPYLFGGILSQSTFAEMIVQFKDFSSDCDDAK